MISRGARGLRPHHMPANCLVVPTTTPPTRWRAGGLVIEVKVLHVLLHVGLVAFLKVGRKNDVAVSPHRLHNWGEGVGGQVSGTKQRVCVCVCVRVGWASHLRPLPTPPHQLGGHTRRRTCMPASWQMAWICAPAILSGRATKSSKSTSSERFILLVTTWTMNVRASEQASR